MFLEEKSEKDFYKMLLKGDAPIDVGNMFKEILHQSNANFKNVSDLSHITTSQGRHYRKT